MISLSKLQIFKFQASQFLPDAETYVKNAIETLGRFDSSSGYWIHDIQTFFISLLPMWLRTKVGFCVNYRYRNEYFKLQNKSDL